jgi:hypothetical protein
MRRAATDDALAPLGVRTRTLAGLYAVVPDPGDSADFVARVRAALDGDAPR